MTMESKQLICVSNLYQTTVNCQTHLFSNKPELFEHVRQMYSETVMAFDRRHLSVKHSL